MKKIKLSPGYVLVREPKQDSFERKCYYEVVNPGDHELKEGDKVLVGELEHEFNGVWATKEIIGVYE